MNAVHEYSVSQGVWNNTIPSMWDRIIIPQIFYLDNCKCSDQFTHISTNFTVS